MKLRAFPNQSELKYRLRSRGSVCASKRVRGRGRFNLFGNCSRRKIGAVLAVVFTGQVGLLCGYMLGQGSETAPNLVGFDPQASLTGFVIWSDGRFDDESFGPAVQTFQARVAEHLEAFATRNGVVVLRTDAVLSQSPRALPDVTRQIMEKVLDDTAF